MTPAAERRDDTAAAERRDDTAVVIVNYESRTALTRCVAGLLARESEGAGAAVVVVDNGSADGSLDETRRRFPAVQVVVPGRNLGYGAAANRGVAATSASHILVCNPDLEVDRTAIDRLVTALDTHPRWALVGPLIRTAAGDRYPSARRFPSLPDAAGHALLGLFVPDNRFTRTYQQSHLDDPGAAATEVDWVSGACFLIRRSAFEQVGGFDESYFMYAEDVDLCWRLGQAAWRVGYLPTAEVTHVQGVSTGRRPYRMIAEHHRSLLRFAVRTATGWRTVLLPLVAVGIAVRAALAVLSRVVRS